MRLDELPRSDNIEDRRGETGSAGLGIPGGRGGLGIGTIVVLGLIGWALGIDPRLLIGGAEMISGGGSSSQQQGPRPVRAVEPGRHRTKSASWCPACSVARKSNGSRSSRNPAATMSLRRSSCSRARPVRPAGLRKPQWGRSTARMIGRSILIRRFSRISRQRFRACNVGSKTCQFSQAYVIAHEVGHHVQNLLGILPKVQSAQRGMDKVEANRLQVRVELQADCLAGDMGKPCAADLGVHRARRRRVGIADGIRHRRRPVAAAGAGLCRARRLYPRILTTTHPMVHHGPQIGRTVELRYLCDRSAIELA